MSKRFILYVEVEEDKVKDAKEAAMIFKSQAGFVDGIISISEIPPPEKV